ncbi:MAG TPA: DUF5642 family protein [Mycobacterium sp.]|nr:DUF5642 family protein [Mycobacterium sp.]HZA09916.1 DUF5642 family protein [Mycobacterium sp.]
MLLAVCITACSGTFAGPQTPTPSKSSATQAVHVTPSNIRRVRAAFPPGYELAEIAHAPSPAGYWGLGRTWTADPAPCSALANPVSGDEPPQGLAGSGPGGIIYAVVAASTTPLVLDPAVVAACPQWSMNAGRTTAAVELTAAPQVDAAATVGMAAATRTVVEGGTETASQIQTVSAYLDDYLAFVVVVTDPGSPQAQLPPELAATLLVRAVAELRR